jgi:hypothetical protein
MIKGEPEVMEEDLAHSGENPLNPGRITSSHVGSGTLKLGTGKLKELLNSERVAKALRDSMDKQMIVGIAGKDLKAGDMVTVDEHGRLIEIRNDWVNGEKIVKRETQDGRITVQKISMKDPGGRRPEDFFITIDEALEEKLKMGAFTQDQLRDLFKKEVTAEHRRRDKEDKLR